MIHLEIHNHAVLKRYVLAVLTAYFEYSVNLWIDYRRTGGLCGNLVYHHIGPDKITGKIPARPGRCSRQNPNLARNLGANHIEPFAHSLERPARGHQIRLRQHPSVAIHNHDISAYRADIHAEICIYRPVCLGQEIVMNKTFRHRLRRVAQGLPPRRAIQRHASLFQVTVYLTKSRGPNFVGPGPTSRNQHRPYGTGEEMLVRHNKLAFCELKYLLHRTDNPDVRRDPAGKHYRLDKFPAAAQIALEVSRKRQTQPGNDVIHRRRLLLKMDHIALGKYRATARHTRY